MLLLATNSAANPLSYSAVNLPAGLSIANGGGAGSFGFAFLSGTISSSAHTDGPYSVTLTATDTVTSDTTSETFTWSVAQPVVTLTNPGDQSNYDGDAVSFTVSASDTASHSLTFTVSGLPSGLSINSSTGANLVNPTEQNLLRAFETEAIAGYYTQATVAGSPVRYFRPAAGPQVALEFVNNPRPSGE